MSKKYMPFFWTGTPMSFDYSSQPNTEYGRQRYDAFGRQIQTFDLDGTITLQSSYHALSTDLWDAADITPGQHQGSYASERKDGHGRTIQTTERFRASGNMEQRHVRTTYLPTSEPLSIERVRGTESVIRWMRYDSLGRMVLNVEPNTSTGFDPSPLADPSGIEAWRYQYNHFGDLIATSDARGCGQNFYYDGAGRILGEDYAPCESHHAAYSAPTSAQDAGGLEVAYYYDDPSSLPAGVAPAGWTGSAPGGSFSTGRAIAVLDRGSASFTTFDGRGRTVATQTQIAKPRALDSVTGEPAVIAAVAERYAPRVYARSMHYDAADREVKAGTGVEALRDSGDNSLGDLMSPGGESACTTEYSERGAVKTAGSSYGSLVSNIKRTADNLVTSIEYGDAQSTTTAYLYDERRRISSVQTYRGPPASGGGSEEPTNQMVLQDEDFLYDVVGNPVEVRDWRDPAEWPAGAKPVTKKIEYDDLYRATRVKYEYAEGDDVWNSPFDAELDGNPNNDDERRAQPSPHVAFQRRILEQSFQYDWLGNNEKTGDDANGFYDRSLGDLENDGQKPYQLTEAASASGASDSDDSSFPGVSSNQTGSLQTKYDAAGSMVGMSLSRNGTCLGGAAGDCSQRFVYDWDEVGRIVRARRWDGNAGSVDDPVPSGTPAADLRNTYDASDQRVVKEAVDASDNKSYTLYIFASLELRRTQYGAGYGTDGSSDDFEVSIDTVVPYLMANGVRLARLVYHGSSSGVPEVPENGDGGPGEVNASTSQLHVFFELGDHLGSTSVVLDKATGELVERATFQAYGGTESDYRPDRWKSFREDYRFTGKEEDVEVGLQYFGKRYLNPLLGRWVSADPLAVHAPGEADLNLYAYVTGRVLMATDPLGLECAGGGDCDDDVGAGESPSQETQADDGSGGNSSSYNDPSYQGEFGASSENAYGSTEPAKHSFEDGGHPLSPELGRSNDPCAHGACVLLAPEPMSSMTDGSGTARYEGGGGAPAGTTDGTPATAQGNARQTPNLSASEAESHAQNMSIDPGASYDGGYVEEGVQISLAAKGLGGTVSVGIRMSGNSSEYVIGFTPISAGKTANVSAYVRQSMVAPADEAITISASRGPVGGGVIVGENGKAVGTELTYGIGLSTVTYSVNKQGSSLAVPVGPVD